MKSKLNYLRLVAGFTAWLATTPSPAPAGDYSGQVEVRFEGDSTLHAFTGNITNLPVRVRCETNSAGAAVLHTTIEIAPKQLTTHHAKRDANMYKMFQSDKYPKLLVVVTNAPLVPAKLAPVESDVTSGTLPIQLTFCGLSKEVQARTANPRPLEGGWEFDLSTDLSLKAFQLRPPSVLFGAISVDDTVRVFAHVKVQATHPQP